MVWYNLFMMIKQLDIENKGYQYDDIQKNVTKVVCKIYKGE